MSTAIKLSDELVADAKRHGAIQQRSTPKQIEYWAKIGKLAKENPELPVPFLESLLVAIDEYKNGEVTEFEFEDLDY